MRRRVLSGVMCPGSSQQTSREMNVRSQFSFFFFYECDAAVNVLRTGGRSNGAAIPSMVYRELLTRLTSRGYNHTTVNGAHYRPGGGLFPDPHIRSPLRLIGWTYLVYNRVSFSPRPPTTAYLTVTLARLCH